MKARRKNIIQYNKPTLTQN